jgi:hypothetical protein
MDSSFNKIGAGVSLLPMTDFWSANRGNLAGFRITVERGRFLINKPAGVELQVLDCKPKDRHLLLMARGGAIKQKFLCGHDERDWFVASVAPRTTNVAAAKDSLRPAAVTDALRQHGVRNSKRHRRHNAGFIRQGEWFFTKAADLNVNPHLILRDEKLVRPGGGKPHIVQELYRQGGTSVMVHRQHAPGGMNLETYAKLATDIRSGSGWSAMRRDPEAYARGTVRHADHETIHLSGWHRIHLNAEVRARNLGFLD